LEDVSEIDLLKTCSVLLEIRDSLIEELMPILSKRILFVLEDHQSFQAGELWKNSH
jgi:hypothetical protein